ncbi:MAG: class I SAM-dependent methyltransferase [Kiritimatiellaeota bacterium]|nr:class I SAM-dependent methyltransferase [Kiritimatiellota bacterium]
MDDSYELLDSGGERKLERFGRLVLARPCAQAVWEPSLSQEAWEAADAAFDREEGHRWHNRRALPESWVIDVDGSRFRLSGTDFGHLGIFPEQRAQWQWIRRQVARWKGRTPPRILNLFAYSGGSTLAAARSGAEVCHVDASHGMVEWASENARLNGLADHAIRWIVDDVHKFLHREARREKTYHGIILDPPTFGRGGRGETYKIERDLSQTLSLCKAVLDKDALFLLLSAHTPGYSPVVMHNILSQALRDGTTESGEMTLTGSEGVLPLPSGAYARWEKRCDNRHDGTCNMQGNVIDSPQR